MTNDNKRVMNTNEERQRVARTKYLEHPVKK